PATGRVTLQKPADWVKGGLTESVTVAGWVKLRFRPLALFRVESANGTELGHLTVTGNRIVLDTKYPRDPRTDDHPSDGSRVSAPWNRDDRWHHVAAVRERTDTGERALLYLDGRRIGEAAVPPGNWSEAARITFAQGIDLDQRSWVGPTG